jgi:hypothetical protein
MEQTRHCMQQTRFAQNLKRQQQRQRPPAMAAFVVVNLAHKPFVVPREDLVYDGPPKLSHEVSTFKKYFLQSGH